jgi:hypothetical protein
MDIEKIVVSENLDLFVIFWPVMKLKSTHALQYGDIGPISKLTSKYPALSDLSPSLSLNYVNGEQIEEPVVAVSSSNPQELMDEVEFITLFTCSPGMVRGAVEILGQRHLIALYEKDNLRAFNINGYSMGYPLESLHNLRFEYFPHYYFTWDDEAIANFEDLLSATLSNNFFHALQALLSEVEDKEARRDRDRILVSIKIFNEAMIPANVPSLQSYSKSYLILLGAAFEALLNLPQDNIGEAFRHSVMLLAGNRSAVLKKWCKEFYNYRSRLAHGDVEWYGMEESFKMGGNKVAPFPTVASGLFFHCLKTKLFLMGLYPEYKREEFLLESFAQKDIGPKTFP